MKQWKSEGLTVGIRKLCVQYGAFRTDQCTCRLPRQTRWPAREKEKRVKRRCNVLARFWKSAFRGAAAGNRKKPALFWDRSAGKKRGSRLFLQSAVDWIVRRSFLGLSGDADEEKNERQKRTEGKRSMCDTRGSLYAAFAFLFVSTARSVSSFAATDVVASASSAFCLGKPRVLFEWIGRDLHPFLLFSPFYLFFFFFCFLYSAFSASPSPSVVFRAREETIFNAASKRRRALFSAGLEKIIRNEADLATHGKVRLHCFRHTREGGCCAILRVQTERNRCLDGETSFRCIVSNVCHGNEFGMKLIVILLYCIVWKLWQYDIDRTQV